MYICQEIILQGEVYYTNMPFDINHYLHFTCLSAGSAAEIKTGVTANIPMPLPVFLLLNTSGSLTSVHCGPGEVMWS